MSRRRWMWLLPLAVATLALGGFLVHAASDEPDGLEKVAEQHGFADREAAVHRAPVPDYELPWYKTALGKSAVGLGGVGLTFVLVYGLGLVLHRRREDPADETTRPPHADEGS